MKRLDITNIQYGGLVPKKCYPQYKGEKHIGIVFVPCVNNIKSYR